LPRSRESGSPDTALQPSETATLADHHPAASAGAANDRTLGNALSGLLRHHIILLLIVALIIVFSILEPRTFPTLANFHGIVLGQAVSTLLALAVLLVVVTGEFDLSVGYILGFSAVLGAALTGVAGLPALVGFGASLIAGGLIGLLSGTLTARLGVNSLIATLGVGLAVSGLSVGVSGGQILSTNIPRFFATMARTPILGLGSAAWIVLVIAVVMYVVLTKTPVGRKLYATGGSEQVARLVGIRVRLLKTMAFVIAGVLAALAGSLQLGLSGAANPSFGSNLLLPAFAAVFLGSTTVRPGFFNVWGTILAIILLAVGFSGMSLAGAPFWMEPVFDGVALIVGVLLSRWNVISSRMKKGK
jgi:ribose transport system permease protein